MADESNQVEKLHEFDFDGQKVMGVELVVEASTEKWSDFTLSDGTVLRAKVTLASAHRIKDRFDEGGRPMYMAHGQTTIMVLKAPDELMKGSE